MSALWFVGGGLFLAAISSMFVSWLKAPPLSQRALWIVAIVALCGSVACGVVAALPSRAGKNDAANGAPVHCPIGSIAKAPSTGVIAGVRVAPVSTWKICVAWINPDNPDVVGFVISEYPQDAAGDVTPSGAPYPNPSLSSQLINVAMFDPSVRPRSGQHWKICVTPFGQGLNSAGLYPTFDARQGCSATFTWPA